MPTPKPAKPIPTAILSDPRLHKPKGSRKGTWAVRVNANWRVTFRFDADGVSDVNLEDYH
jgi:plasmid maintenance system killer protein